MKTVSFYLPGAARAASGGHKVVFQYANALTAKGYRVNILMDSRRMLLRFHLPEFLRRIAVRYLCKIRPTWFSLKPEVHKYCLLDPDKDTPEADWIFATAVGTAEPVANLPPKCGQKLYFIQGYENWNGVSDAEVRHSYTLGMKNVVIAKWLYDIVKETVKDEVFYVPNFVDTDIFAMDVKPEARNPYTVAMLCAAGPHKGTRYGLEALKKLKEKYPGLEVCLFGTPERPEEAEPWMSYTRNASEKELRDIYNRSAIYLYPSVEEGWGLTGMEAMACGCAYVSSDYGGIHEYATDGENALISPAKDVDALVANASRLIEDEKLRTEMAWKGYGHIRENFSLTHSLERLLHAMGERE